MVQPTGQPAHARRRWPWIAGATVSLLVIFGVIGAVTQEKKPSAHPSIAASTSVHAATSIAQPPTTHVSAAASRNTASAPHLFGFGATVADWNVTHRPDTDFTPGSAYGRDPNLPPINGHVGAKYVTVSVISGRVLAYQLNLLARTAIAQALSGARLEFPSDVRLLWQLRSDACIQAEFQSATVGTDLAATGDASGQVSVNFYDLGQAAPYVLLSDTPAASAADAGGC